MTDSPITPESIAQLRAAIAGSGLSVRRWAREVAWREPSTVQRWLAGTSPIPDVVRARLDQIARQSASTEPD